MMSTREMILGWLRISDMGIAAVGRIADASLVVVASFLASSATVFGILEARKDALSLARMTWMEEAMCWTSDWSRGTYRGWIEDIVNVGKWKRF